MTQMTSQVPLLYKELASTYLRYKE